MIERKPVALVLCGGAGTRMLPWSEHRHKCLLPVGPEMTPLLVRHVSQLRANGFRVVANVNEKWHGAFRDAARGAGLPLEVIAESGEPHGAGTTLMRVAREHPSAPAYATVCGDVWYSDWWYAELHEMAEFVAWQDGPSVGLFATTPDPTELGGPGQVDLAPGFASKYVAVRGVREAPCRRWPNGAIQAAGITVWSLAAIDASARGRVRGGIDMMRDMLPRALHSHVRAFARLCARNGIADLGTPLRYAAHVCRQYQENGNAKIGEDAAGGIVAILNARRVFTAGNGGACACAQHAAIDWQKAGGRDVTALADPVVGSAWANDHGYAGALARQVERVADPSDSALVLFTASGASPNVVEAARRARERGFGAVVAVSCADSAAPIYEHATHAVRLPFSRPRTVFEYGAIEDAMQAWMHVTAVVMAGLAPWRSYMAEDGA